MVKRLGVAAALAAGLALPGAAWAAGGGKIQWRPGKDHDAALAEAKAYGRPVMIFFSSDS